MKRLTAAVVIGGVIGLTPGGPFNLAHAQVTIATSDGKVLGPRSVETQLLSSPEYCRAIKGRKGIARQDEKHHFCVIGCAIHWLAQNNDTRTIRFEFTGAACGNSLQQSLQQSSSFSATRK